MEREYECYSASLRDGGVRRKIMPLPSAKWDLIALLVGGSVAVIGHSLAGGQVHHWTEIMFNVAAASYFVMRSRRIHLLSGILQRKGKGYLKIGKETK